MGTKTLADGSITYEQDRKALIILSALIAVPGILSIASIVQGSMPIGALIVILPIGAPGAVILTVFWRKCFRTSLKISEHTVNWGTHSIDLADIEAVDIVEEATGSGVRQIEQLVLAFSVRGGGELRCRALNMFIGTADKQQLVSAKEEIERRAAARSGRRDADSSVPFDDVS